MQFGRLSLAAAVLLASCTPSFAYTHARRGPTSSLFRHRTSSSRTPSKPSGPRAMEPERATEIQTALIKSGYLSGEPTGRWDTASEAAMQKLQGDNGWQTKLTPDSRALIKLGLGPKNDAPETASNTAGSTQFSAPSTANIGFGLQQ